MASFWARASTCRTRCRGSLWPARLPTRRRAVGVSRGRSLLAAGRLALAKLAALVPLFLALFLSQRRPPLPEAIPSPSLRVSRKFCLCLACRTRAAPPWAIGRLLAVLRGHRIAWRFVPGARARRRNAPPTLGAPRTLPGLRVLVHRRRHWRESVAASGAWGREKLSPPLSAGLVGYTR